MKNIALLGATGSIGEQTLEVIRQHKDKFSVFALAFGTNAGKAIPMIREFEPEAVVTADEETRQKVFEATTHKNIMVGSEGMVAVAKDPGADVFVNAVMGSIGLPATLEAIRSRKRIAIANKETLVTAGHLVMAESRKYDTPLLPVDSEHSAIFQALNGERNEDVRRLIITASGGSFRDKTREELQGVNVKDALNHPNWNMGAKITVDSASMMNKGLEVIEAHWLFNMPYDKIHVLLHRESVIHSLVEFQDRSVMAQLGSPDMKVPIQYALSYPERIPLSGSESLELEDLAELHFQKMDMERFRCLKFAFQAGRQGGSMPAVLNAANEQAVAMFLNEQISFLDIEAFVERALTEHNSVSEPSLSDIIEIDKETRKRVERYVK
ncbi:1-deoxy-D-xylulose-5-phosphate reductoisomerase [Salimicrobium jeotgali]|uniref:1-deoxy-D-xylulose 5-phosphate reductoisomerase n=2 Tax=Salimicrobium TaxID=351195 RepID=K2GCN6_9BACI|nr:MULTISPECIES: 1-deoxy-D-xylulose-5-phosphate reductoisomerase [Salimicrobium]AKG04549.1 1-deoxy-D-xylulose-5-phosphate reductoisomerase [Salimicrobium jeotgali]EKE32763.1 1-deoxy-D-xylulose 5-phosphate reductoisomerase [Salimicrobium jeotgali]MBM7695249.1 1-deoxy-D-xylulose-5-phosphate reductoisomerase [Salimicrobium jeotgali]SIS63925.1 1-deoxy-D-xylulose 5-phosphate reductoisomerase [Salimicrobium salexigens]